MIDAAAYFARIGFRDRLAADRDAIDALILHHTRAVAFENLDALGGIDPAFDDAALMRKLVRRRRGGWCFEHNHLLGSVLRRSGIDVTPLAARVLWRQSDERPARGHMLLAIRLGGETRIADAGFGLLCPTATLSVETSEAQTTPHERFRVVPDADDGYRLEAELDDAWRPVYAFDLRTQYASDYRITSWYLANHPASLFRRHLVLARPLADGRATLLDDRLTVRRAGGTTIERVGDLPALERALLEVFDIDLAAEEPAVRRRLAAWLRERREVSGER